MKLPRNPLKPKLSFSPFPTPIYFKHTLQRDAASLQVLQALALAPSLDESADADYLAAVHHQPSGSHRDDRSGSEYLKQLYIPQSWQFLQNKGRRAARLPRGWCEYITVSHLMRRHHSSNILACKKFYNQKKKIYES